MPTPRTPQSQKTSLPGKKRFNTKIGLQILAKRGHHIFHRIIMTSSRVYHRNVSNIDIHLKLSGMWFGLIPNTDTKRHVCHK